MISSETKCAPSTSSGDLTGCRPSSSSPRDVAYETEIIISTASLIVVKCATTPLLIALTLQRPASCGGYIHDATEDHRPVALRNRRWCVAQHLRLLLTINERKATEGTC